ncbi:MULTISPECIES: GldG family protein [Paenibacillus]|uniref:GldG family protein n=1 Tax=Paenibacillus TaxID=44249 RepID=UPI0010B08993|nr:MULTISPECIES: GldG family protein [Paenibacillus]NTZ20534.1 ABC transporter [Paenibacillus sp. JMULE4]GCL73729.1 ABC transporter [Paenibacillus naphthalenovorans]
MNKWIRGTNAVVLSLAVIGIFIVLTIFLNSMKGLQLDLTLNKKFSLSEQTTQTLAALEQDVRIVSLTSDQTDPYIKRQVVELVQEYKKRSGKITFDEYDIVKQPAIAKQYDVNPSGTLVVESGTQKNTINYYDMFLPGQQQGEYQFSGEEKLTQALVNLNSKEKRKVYFLSGHNEIPLNQMNTWRSGLEGENYEVADLNLLREGKIPEDAEMLFIIGPEHDISDQEAQLIKSYLDGKGKLYLALGFNQDMATGWKNIDGLMSAYGIKDQHAVAIEPKQSVLYDPLTIIPEYGPHKITEKLQQYNLLTMMTLAVSLNADQPNENYSVTPILKTTSAAYGETDLKRLAQSSQSSKDQTDIQGPLNLGYVVENKDQKPKAVVLGGSTLFVDRVISQQGNRDFALNSVAWLQEQTNQVTIRPRQGDAIQTALVTAGQANMIFYGTVLVFPLLFLIFGGTIWWRRRKG